MKYIIKKDQNKRKQYASQELSRRINQFLFCMMSHKNGRISRFRSLSTFCFLRQSRYRSRVFTQVTRRCLLTGRGRGTLRFVGISRSSLRELLGFGVLPGYKKAMW